MPKLSSTLNYSCVLLSDRDECLMFVVHCDDHQGKERLAIILIAITSHDRKIHKTIYLQVSMGRHFTVLYELKSKAFGFQAHGSKAHGFKKEWGFLACLDLKEGQAYAHYHHSNERDIKEMWIYLELYSS